MPCYCNSSVLSDSPNAALNKTILNRYLELPQPENAGIQAEYVWIDGTVGGLRSKTRRLAYGYIPSPSEMPTWTCDGSLLEQVGTANSEVLLQPVAIYKDPFFPHVNNILVLCDTYDFKREPTASNKRYECRETMQSPVVQREEPWFGIAQDYKLLDSTKGLLAGQGLPTASHASSDYYCGVGADKVVAREIAVAHYRACLYAGVSIHSFNAEAKLSQWKYQLNPSPGIAAGDDLWISRFILLRVAEEFGVSVRFQPTWISNICNGRWHMTGGQTNFSTKSTRGENGIEEIHKIIQRMKLNHSKDMMAYNPQQSPNDIPRFRSSIANRNVSVRIPTTVAEQRKGYLEDRRSNSDCDFYSVINVLVRTCILNE